LQDSLALQRLSAAGRAAVTQGGYDNDSVVRQILDRCELLQHMPE
jgi:hypothetical protein